MDKIHHIAIEVKSIKDTIDWYKKHSKCKVTYAGNFTIIPVDCVMFLQQSSNDYRLDKAIQDKYKFTSCCLQTPEEYEVFKKGL